MASARSLFTVRVLFHPPVYTFYLWISKKHTPCCAHLLDTISSSRRPLWELFIPALINIKQYQLNAFVSPGIPEGWTTVFQRKLLAIPLSNKQTKKTHINWLPSVLPETHLERCRQTLMASVLLSKKLKRNKQCESGAVLMCSCKQANKGLGPPYPAKPVWRAQKTGW